MKSHCIACESPNVARLGSLPAFPKDFLGVPLNGDLTAGCLYRCRNCTLRFRVPTPTAEELMKFYSRLPAEQLWQHEPDRLVWRRIVQILDTCPEKSILDVGCFRGDFLTCLGEGWSRFGIEPSVDARREAESNGINIIGSSVETVDSDAFQFGAIVLTDVIEHLTRPLEALQKLSRMLKPGGKLIVFTGNVDALSWRFSGLEYWYSALPEHVAFFSPAWFTWAAPKLNSTVRLLQRMPSRQTTILDRLDESLKNIAYAIYHRLDGLPPFAAVLPKIPVIQRIATWRDCWWTSATDHLLVALTKNEIRS